MSQYEKIKAELLTAPKTWLVTGVAGFIGSNLLEHLLKLNQSVVGLDNFATGHQHNLDEVKGLVSTEQWQRFTFIKGDICHYQDCETALTPNGQAVDYVLHQAALGSVPRSIADPITTNMVNITGFLTMLQAAKEAKVKSFTYAASSSTYGDHPALPKVEENIGNPLSPYAVTKYVNELYASVYARTYGFKTIGLRYFNVFGETSRDFCFIENTVQMNILAATAPDQAKDEVYNVAVGDRTTLNELYKSIQLALQENDIEATSAPIFQDFRAGDVRHSQADVSKAVNNLGYAPEYRILEGIAKAMPWYTEFLGNQ